jgi:hypothetical protein
MPIADEMKSFLMHRINFTLFLASVRDIKMSRTKIRRPWPGHLFDHDTAFDESSEQLPARFEGIGMTLLILREMD